jgi:hypothetical protein
MAEQQGRWPQRVTIIGVALVAFGIGSTFAGGESDSLRQQLVQAEGRAEEAEARSAELVARGQGSPSQPIPQGSANPDTAPVPVPPPAPLPPPPPDSIHVFAPASAVLSAPATDRPTSAWSASSALTASGLRAAQARHVVIQRRGMAEWLPSDVLSRSTRSQVRQMHDAKDQWRSYVAL